jgi:hypothetical protein
LDVGRWAFSDHYEETLKAEEREQAGRQGDMKAGSKRPTLNAQRSMSNSEVRREAVVSDFGVGRWMFGVGRFLIITKKLWQPRKENRPGDREI